MFAGVPAEFDSCSAVTYLDSGESHRERAVGAARCADWVGCSIAAASAAQIVLLVGCVEPGTYSGSVDVFSSSAADQVC